MAAPGSLQIHVSLDNSSYNGDSKVIQAANPIFLGMTNPLDESIMTSLGHHIGFQDGGTWELSNACFP